MADHVVARVDELPDGERRIVRAGKLEIGVFNVRGRYYALPNVCAHQFGPLCEGRITGYLLGLRRPGADPAGLGALQHIATIAALKEKEGEAG